MKYKLLPTTAVACVKPCHHAVYRASSTLARLQVDSGNDAERKKQLLEFFEERAIHRNEEGLVVKDLTSHYMASRRAVSFGLSRYRMCWSALNVGRHDAEYLGLCLFCLLPVDTRYLRQGKSVAPLGLLLYEERVANRGS